MGAARIGLRCVDVWMCVSIVYLYALYFLFLKSLPAEPSKDIHTAEFPSMGSTNGSHSDMFVAIPLSMLCHELDRKSEWKGVCVCVWML